MLTNQLTTWLSAPQPESFPYDAVVAEFQRVGKHFVAADVLALLDRARATQPTGVLARFLDVALDKHDGRYDNPSYLAVDLLPLPSGDDPHRAAAQRDRLLALLIADTLRFEIAAADGWSALMPQLRPDARITAKRCRLGLRALERIGVEADSRAHDAVAEARDVCREILGGMDETEARTLRLTALPVSLVHDEYMFLRMLQCYETTFAMMAVELGDAVSALADGEADFAARAIAAAQRALNDAKPLWSLVATMQPEAFLRFREFTEGASAIQSRSYKVVESLCRRPEAARLDSPAYHAVPDVRERVLSGQATIDETLTRARAAGWLTSDTDDGVRSAMQAFEAALLKWRQSHYRLAVKMLGERRGTGYTEGVPYLGKVRALPVFAAA